VRSATDERQDTPGLVAWFFAVTASIFLAGKDFRA
jgi:hypothetical protein